MFHVSCIMYYYMFHVSCIMYYEVAHERTQPSSLILAIRYIKLDFQRMLK